MTGLDVLDSAVKIGLGALIAGLSGLHLSKAQHANSLQKARIEREFQLLKDVAEKVERFTTASLRYWALVADWHRKRARTPEAAKPQQLEEAGKGLFDIFSEVTSAEALLLLMGHEDAQIELRKYGDLVASFRRSTSVPEPLISQEQFEDFRLSFLRARSEFFNLLSKKYQMVSTPA